MLKEIIELAKKHSWKEQKLEARRKAKVGGGGGSRIQMRKFNSSSEYHANSSNYKYNRPTFYLAVVHISSLKFGKIHLVW